MIDLASKNPATLTKAQLREVAEDLMRDSPADRLEIASGFIRSSIPELRDLGWALARTTVELHRVETHPVTETQPDPDLSPRDVTLMVLMCLAIGWVVAIVVCYGGTP